jgi:hypothetical protein
MTVITSLKSEHNQLIPLPLKIIVEQRFPLLEPMCPVNSIRYRKTQLYWSPIMEAGLVYAEKTKYTFFS